MEDSTQQNSALHQQAIDAALDCNWELAIELNRQIAVLEPTNTTALNRLAKALSEIGKYLEAKKTYEQVLALDPYNTIADKNLKRISIFKKDAPDGFHNKDHLISLSPALFVQEPGITKIVNLTKIAEPQKLSTLSAGMIVDLMPKAKSINIVDSDNQYLGVLPDDTAHHILKLIAGGNKYQVIIKSVKSNSLSVLIREVFRSKKFRNQSSFLDETNIVSMSSDNLKLMPSDQMDERIDDESYDMNG